MANSITTNNQAYSLSAPTFTGEVKGNIKTACIEFINQLNKKAFIGTWQKAVGTGPTAVGRTFEHLYGIKMNSKPGPDIFINNVGFEFKSGVFEAPNLGTLFCKEAGRGENRRILTDYAFESDGRRSLYATVTSNGTTVGDKTFKVSVLNEDLNLLIDDNVYCTWQGHVLKKAATRKLGHVLARIKADERYENGQQYLNFNKLSLHTGYNHSGLLNAFENSLASIDLRAYFKDKYSKKGLQLIRNHGTAVRMVDSHIENLFSAKAIMI
jgi:hypothetical protein